MSKLSHSSSEHMAEIERRAAIEAGELPAIGDHPACECRARPVRPNDIDPPEPTRSRECPIHGDEEHRDLSVLDPATCPNCGYLVDDQGTTIDPEGCCHYCRAD